MHRRIPMFGVLEIETCSDCNRTCTTCLRNSYPDREAVKSWFQDVKLSTELVHQILHEAVDLGFQRRVNFQHYNEPLLDDRICDFGRYAKKLGFKNVEICTNGDLIDDEMAKELNDSFTRLKIALYMDGNQKAEREAYLRSVLTISKFTGGGHIATHFSPGFNVVQLSRKHAGRPCSLPLQRLVINHRGDQLLCCEDLIGHFGLGNIRTCSLEEMWFGKKHQDIVLNLLEKGGRKSYKHCLNCPRK